MRPAVARIRAHHAAAGQHGLRAVGRHARQHVDQNGLEPVFHVGGKIQLVLAPMQRDQVLGDGERHARAAHLHGVHVAIDPRRCARAVGVLADLEQPEIAPFDALADALHAHDAGVCARPVVDDARQLFIANVIGAEWAHLEFGARVVIILRRQLSLSDGAAFAAWQK